MSQMKRQTWIGTFIGIVYRLYSATWSYHVCFAQGSRSVNLKTKHPECAHVIGHWHGDELALIGYGRQSKLLTLSSRSKDGSIMAAALNVLGVAVVRGSSSRGGMRGLVSMIRMLRKETIIISFAVDGPTGPRHRAKTGVYLFALKTYLPKPFARIELLFFELPKPTVDNKDEILSIFNSRSSFPE